MGPPQQGSTSQSFGWVVAVITQLIPGFSAPDLPELLQPLQWVPCGHQSALAKPAAGSVALGSPIIWDMLQGPHRWEGSILRGEEKL